MADNTGQYSFEAYEKFLDFVDEKGLMGRATAQGLKVAASKVKEHLSEAELEDVREIDSDAAFQRLMNKGGTLKPSTLKEYIRRMDRGVAEFKEWLKGPAEYRPKGTTSRNSGGSAKRVPAKRRAEESPETGGADRLAASEGSRIPGRGQKASITIPFPLRSDFVVHLEVPRDLKLNEAKRLSAFMETLAMDYETSQ
jgi:hypothetical protein